MNFYTKVVTDLIRSGDIDIDDSILVVAAGSHDRDSLIAAGLKNVVISNLEPHAGHTDYAPYSWERLDGELIDKADESFDWVFEHDGLHHLAVPAKGVCEMFRVARKGILCFESRDSALMKAAMRIGLTDCYELEPAHLTKGVSGGYRGGPIPNYVYRWKEREFEKVVNSYAPSHEHSFFYRYSYRMPTQRFAMARNAALRAAGVAIGYAIEVAKLIAPKQGNQFAFGARKNVAIQPWLDENLQYKQAYLADRYDSKRYWRNAA